MNEKKRVLYQLLDGGVNKCKRFVISFNLLKNEERKQK